MKSEDDVASRVRARLVEVLALIADPSNLRVFQSNARSVNVAEEMFNLWDDWYHPDAKDFAAGMDGSERAALAAFDEALKSVSERTPRHMPALEVFLASEGYSTLREAARPALSQMWTIRPDETQLIGQWGFENRKMRADAVVERIEWLVEHQLERVASDWSKWYTLYRDPADGRYWERAYLQGHLQGAGPPSLLHVTPAQIERRYGLDV